MRYHELLLEYNRDITLSRYKDKLIKRIAQTRGVSTNLIYSFDPERQVNMLRIILENIEMADPTPNKQYTPFLVKMFVEGGPQSEIEDLKSTVKDYLIKFHKLKARRQLPSPRNDIMRYNNLADLMDVMDEYPDPDELDKPVDKGESETVLDTDQVRIIIPYNEEAACYYGQGTRWCTAARKDNRFSQYARTGHLYILLPKQPKHPGEKYQIHVQEDQYMDERDEEVDPKYILEKRFGNLLPWFKKREPDLGEMLVFTDDNIIKEMVNKFKTPIMDHVYEIVNGWESEDDYYQRELINQGYVFPEGHPEEGMIDWEKVSEDNLDYLDYNEDAKEFVNTVQSTLDDTTPIEIKDKANEIYGHDASLTYVTDVVARLINENLTRYKWRNDAGLSDWIDDHLAIGLQNAETGEWVGWSQRFSDDNVDKLKFTPYYSYRDSKGNSLRTPL